jgi:hypothetical protein
MTAAFMLTHYVTGTVICLLVKIKIQQFSTKNARRFFFIQYRIKMDNKKSFFVVNKYTCTDCNYSTQLKFYYDKHI